MTTDDRPPEPPASLPPAVIDAVSGLDEDQLRDVIDFAQRRRRQIHQDITERIEAGPGEEIVSVEEQPGYTLVAKRQPCAVGCAECPHGPYVYHVREEPRPEGGSRVHWSYLGPLEP